MGQKCQKVLTSAKTKRKQMLSNYNRVKVIGMLSVKKINSSLSVFKQNLQKPPRLHRYHYFKADTTQIFGTNPKVS